MAAELGMHLHDVLGWGGPMTDRQQAAWFAFLRWKNDPDHVDGIDMDGCVPPDVQERWAAKVRSVGMQTFHMNQKRAAARAAAPASPGAPPVTPRAAPRPAPALPPRTLKELGGRIPPGPRPAAEPARKEGP